ncbi:DNA damage-regulated autophagy modulator protein 2 [Aphelenchoides fujianensis]|nr:DNA damage-regulated autophagy modulator protein 2 [Aphelenchoides fujianensis]
MGLQQVWVIPLLTFIFSLSAFVVSYSISVSLKHVSAFWPYVSDTGAFPPESCVFGQLLNPSRSLPCGILWIGYASALGVSIVANFQESNVIVVHYLGALLAFGSGFDLHGKQEDEESGLTSRFQWAQTFLSYSMNPKLARPVVSHCRAVLCCFSTVFFVLMIVFGPILGRHPHEGKEGGDLYKWTGSEPNYIEHMLRHAYVHAPKLKLIAFLDGQDSAISPDVFDCCVLPAAVIGRKDTEASDVGEVLGGRADDHSANHTMNTISTRVSMDESAVSDISAHSSASSPAQLDDVVVR